MEPIKFRNKLLRNPWFVLICVLLGLTPFSPTDVGQSMRENFAYILTS